MTQLEALNVAYEELSNMMPYNGENDKVFEAANVIKKMIQTREIQAYKQQIKKNEINDMFADALKDL